MTSGAGALFARALQAGFTCPLLAVQQLAALVAIGALAASLPGGWRLPALFMPATLVGVLCRLWGLDLAQPDFAISVTVCALGILLLADMIPRPPILAGLVVVIGMLHGYRHGEAVVHAAAPVLAGYLLGLAAAQAVLGLGTLQAVRMATADWLARLAGACVLAIGVISLRL